MAPSVMIDKHGPVWPLGNIVVASPGTPVSIMSLVDSTFRDAPENPVGGSTVSGGAVTGAEYTNRAQQIQFQGYKFPGGTGPAVVNTGLVYILKKGGTGTVNRSDPGAVLWVLAPGQTWSLGSAALNRNVFNLYEFFIDADNANDAAQVTAIIQ
jgi:hypothetical protein